MPPTFAGTDLRNGALVRVHPGKGKTTRGDSEEVANAGRAEQRAAFKKLVDAVRRPES